MTRVYAGEMTLEDCREELDEALKQLGELLEGDDTKPIRCAWCHEPYGHQGDNAEHLSNLHKEHRRICTKMPGSEVRNLLLNMRGKLSEIHHGGWRDPHGSYLITEDYINMIESTLQKLLCRI
jgi:hypothetical protein